MKLLFYYDPITDYNDVSWRWGHFGVDLGVIKWAIRKNIDFRIICNSWTYDWVVSQDNSVNQFLDKIIIVNSKELVYSFPSTYFQHNHHFASVERKKLFSTDSVTNSFSQFIKSKLGSFDPTICFTWSPAPFLRNLGPNITVLHREIGIFSSAPFSWTDFFDPLGYGVCSWPSQKFEHCQVLGNETTLSILREKFFEIISKNDPFLLEKSEIKKQSYQQTVLLVAQYSGFFISDVAAPDRSQFELIWRFMESVSSKTGVILSEHPTKKTLVASEIALLKKSFKNFIYVPSAVTVSNASQYWLNFVDGVATVSSSVAWLALFFKKAALPLGESQVNAFGITVKEFESGARYDNKLDSYLQWIIFRYSVQRFLFENPKHDEKILEKFALLSIKNQDEAYLKFMNFKICDESEILQETLQRMDIDIPKLASHGKVKLEIEKLEKTLEECKSSYLNVYGQLERLKSEKGHWELELARINNCRELQIGKKVLSFLDVLAPNGGIVYSILRKTYRVFLWIIKKTN